MGKSIDCPDCGRPMWLVPDRESGVSALGKDPAATPPEEQASAEAFAPAVAVLAERAASAPNAGPGVLDRLTAARERVATAAQRAILPALAWTRETWNAWLTSPMALAWTVAGGLTLVIVTVIVAPREFPRAPAPVVAPPARPESDPKTPQQDRTEDARLRLRALGEKLRQTLAAEGQFPRGTVGPDALQVDERLSWLALYANDGAEGEASAVWERPWDDRQNARFVRRRIPAFLNPAIPTAAGGSRYPATHFVGVAGVGDDGPRLGVDHPRAGVFGWNRRTRREDIRDGLSNTMMVAGVCENLGGWAAGGTATVRPFTREPYVNGPDGFGTGEPDRMLVLMADGSVRSLSSSTDPRVVRRMAAMADGLDLALTIPGEPGAPVDPLDEADEAAVAKAAVDGESVEREDREAADNGQEDAEPVAKPIERTAEDKPQGRAARPGVAVDEKLRMEIVRFEYLKPTPARTILRELSSLAGLAIQVDPAVIGPADPLWDKPLTISLENTTVRAVLDAVTVKLGLTYDTTAEGVQLRPLRVSARPTR